MCDSPLLSLIEDGKMFLKASLNIVCIQNGNARRFGKAIGADRFRTRQADLCIHISTIHIDLSAVRMYQLANIDNLLLKYTMSRRISYHQRSEIVFMQFNLMLKIMEVDITIGIGFCNDHFH